MRKFIVGFIVGLILGSVFAWNLHAALTDAQVSEYFGRAVRYGVANSLIDLDRQRRLAIYYVVIAKDWIPNGAFGTVADRREGVQKALREFYTAQTGRNPVDASTGQEFYKRHWLTDFIGLTIAEANSIEPTL